EQKRAEFAAGAVGDAQAVLGKQAGEELLRQVASLFGIVTAPPNIGVQRIPVRFAERGERLRGGRRSASARRGHDAPARRRKAPAALRQRLGTIPARHGCPLYACCRRRESGEEKAGGTFSTPKRSACRRICVTAVDRRDSLPGGCVTNCPP